MGRKNRNFLEIIRGIIKREDKKIIEKPQREVGASLPEELRDMYKESLYNDSKARLDKYPEKMKRNIELRKQREKDFKEKLQVFQNPDHEKVKQQADIKKQQNAEREIYQILDGYIKENNIIEDNVMTNIENGKVTLAYTNEKGEIIRKEFTVEEVLGMKKKEIVE